MQQRMQHIVHQNLPTFLHQIPSQQRGIMRERRQQDICASAAYGYVVGYNSVFEDVKQPVRADGTEK